jgi:hypothetical protein
LAPASFVGKTTSPAIKFISKLKIAEILHFFGSKEFLPSIDFLKHLIPGVCNLEKWICSNLYCLIAGCDLEDVSPQDLPNFLAHLPAG